MRSRSCAEFSPQIAALNDGVKPVENYFAPPLACDVLHVTFPLPMELLNTTQRIAVSNLADPRLSAYEHVTVFDAEEQAFACSEVARCDGRAAISRLPSTPPTEVFSSIVVRARDFARLGNAETQESTLAALAARLAPAGRLTLSLHNPGVQMLKWAGHWMHVGSFRLEDGHRVMVRARYRYEPRSQRAAGATEYSELNARGTVCNVALDLGALRLLGPRELTGMASRAGLRIETLSGDFGGLPFDPRGSDRMVARLVRCGA